MPLARGIAAVMLDLDGTLLDTIPDIAAAAARTMAALGLGECSREEVRSFIGDGIAVFVERCLRARIGAERALTSHAEALRLFQAFYAEESGRRTGVYPEVFEGLERLRAQRLRLACVTNKAERYTLPLLEAKGLAHYFELVVSGDTLARKKPDPMPLAHICAAFALDPAQVLLIGDSANDVRAARAAGCPMLCVSYGYGERTRMRELGCDAIVDTLSAAADIVLGATKS